MKQLVRNPLLAAAAVLVAVALLLPLVAWYGYRGNLANLERMLYGKGSSLMETVLRESENAMLADREISDLLADRLADNCRFAAGLQRRGLASPTVLDSLARLSGLARLDVYSASRELIVSSRPENSPAVLPEALLDEYNAVEPDFYQGLVTASDAGLSAGDEGTAYFAVALRLPDSGWATAWIDGHKLTALRRRLGLGLILDDLASVRGITYAVLQDSIGIIAASLQVVSLSSISGDPFFSMPEGRIAGRFTTFENKEVYEVTSRFIFEGEHFGFLRLGLSTDEMRLIAASDRRRLALGIIVLAVLLAVVAGLYIYGRRQFRMELEHLRLQGFSRAVLDGMGEAVIVLDAEGRVVQMNPACRRFCAGCDEDRSIGRPLDELAPRLAETVGVLQRERLAARECELRQAGDDDSTVPVLIAISSQQIAGGDYTTVILTDISDRREKERLALRSQRLRTMAEVSAGLAHEIRNPLNAIAMNVQRLKLEFSPAGEEREDYERFVETIRSEVARLNRIVEQFLTFARFPHPVPEPVDLAELARDTVRFSAADLESGAIDVVLDLEPSGELMLDPGQIRQVLTNLLANAAQAAGSGGKIEIGGRRDGDRYVLRVSDSGPGIDEADLEKIFEPFYTTRLKGTGLGLAIAARIVGEHGGTIRAENRDEGGAVFSLTLPVGVSGSDN